MARGLLRKDGVLINKEAGVCLIRLYKCNSLFLIYSRPLHLHFCVHACSVKATKTVDLASASYQVCLWCRCQIKLKVNENWRDVMTAAGQIMKREGNNVMTEPQFGRKAGQLCKPIFRCVGAAWSALPCFKSHCWLRPAATVALGAPVLPIHHAE